MLRRKFLHGFPENFDQPGRLIAPPDPYWIGQLQRTYVSYLPRSPTHPWTVAIATTLGVLYFRAWKSMPTSARMSENYCLPNSGVIRRLFRTYEAFYSAIQLAVAEEE